MNSVYITTEFIKLENLLKLTGSMTTGGQAKLVIKEGLVRHNGEICTERGRKVRPGDTVEFDGEIFVTYDTHFENYMESAEGAKLPVPHCIKGTDGWALNETVAQALDDKKYTAVEKITFGSVELPKLVKEAVGDEDFDITLIGLCTDICVVSNALILKANFPEKEVYVDASCCAGVTVDTHNAALATMKMCQINVEGE